MIRKGVIGCEINYNMKNFIGFFLFVKCVVIVNIKKNNDYKNVMNYKVN